MDQFNTGEGALLIRCMTVMLHSLQKSKECETKNISFMQYSRYDYVFFQVYQHKKTGELPHFDEKNSAITILEHYQNEKLLLLCYIESQRLRNYGILCKTSDFFRE